jgi:hypothetical protein
MLLMSSMGVEMMPVKVKTLSINTNTDCKCNSWLDHWEHWGGERASFCCEELCDNLAMVGGQVLKYNKSHSTKYIVPLCLKHANNCCEELELREGTVFVSINFKETCGAI